MREVFAKRRFTFNQQCLKYLRYVLNDHFVLVLVFLLGFLMVQYSGLLKHFPKNHLPMIGGLSLLILILLWLGRVATYLEPADAVFLLPKEKELISYIRQAKWRTFWIWGGIQTALLLVLAPIFLALGLSKVLFLVLLLALLVVKAGVLQVKHRHFLKGKQLDWSYVIARERARKQSILKFYSLFTTVKGISSQTKRRAYLDGLLRRLPKTQASLWSNLYGRAFLRSGDYLGLTVRLLALSLLALIFVKQSLVAVSLSLLFNYLLLFQLTALAKHYDYQYLTQLFPFGQDKQAQNLKQVIKAVLYTVIVLEVIALLIFDLSFQNLAVLVLVSLFLNEVYLPYKLRTACKRY